MALERFTKQPYEEFVIAGEYSDVLETGETIISGTSTVTSVDTSDDSDSSTEVLDTATKAVDGTQLKMRVKGGVHGEKHKITFRADTSLGNNWEIDVIMKIKET